MLIYRVEKKDGQGAYRGSDTPSFNWNIHSNSKHPGPFSEVWDKRREKLYDDYHFGFENIVSLKEWFNYQDREKLKEYWYYIVVYKVREDITLIGKYQVMFLKEYAKRVDLLDVITCEISLRVKISRFIQRIKDGFRINYGCDSSVNSGNSNALEDKITF